MQPMPPQTSRIPPVGIPFSSNDYSTSLRFDIFLEMRHYVEGKIVGFTINRNPTNYTMAQVMKKFPSEDHVTYKKVKWGSFYCNFKEKKGVTIKGRSRSSDCSFNLPYKHDLNDNKYVFSSIPTRCLNHNHYVSDNTISIVSNEFILNLFWFLI